LSKKKITDENANVKGFTEDSKSMRNIDNNKLYRQRGFTIKIIDVNNNAKVLNYMVNDYDNEIP
jgi:hypothetical protein